MTASASASATDVPVVISGAPVLRDCNGRPEDGAEARLGTQDHCGECNRACAMGERCVGEVCLSSADVAMSRTHTCVLTSTGRVDCMGANEAGEIGDGTTELRDRPTQVRGIDDAEELQVRERETCVRRRSGAVVCWGEAFGTGRPGERRLAPIEIPALRGASDLALSDGVLCGILPDAGIVCLPPTPGDKILRSPGPPPGALASDAVDLAAIGSTLCAARRDGSVTCWNLRPYDDVPATERQWSIDAVQGALGLVGGNETMCALRAGNLAACWGGGIVTTQGGIRDAMVGGVHDFGPLGPVTDLAFLGWPSDDDCATRVDGKTLCWDQPYIEMAQVREPRHPKTRTMDMSPAIHVAATKFPASHCAVTKTDALYCWGQPSLGRLGIGRDPEQLSPRPIDGVRGARQVVASDHRACARTQGDGLTCWGGGHEPRRVDLAGLDRLLSGRCASVRHELVCYADLFTGPLPPSGLRDVVQLVPANQGSHLLSYFARHQDGAISRVEWKREGDDWSLVSAARVAGLAKVKQLLSVDRSTCVREGDAALQCWDSLGQPTFDAEKRVTVELRKGTVPQGLDSVHLTRVEDDGRTEGCGMHGRDLVCWDLFDERKVLPLPGLRRFDVSPSGMRCALLAGGDLKCWDGTYTGHGKNGGVDAPTTVPGLGAVEGFAMVQPGWNEQDAVFAWGRDGRVFAWGHNGGQWGETEAGVLGWTAPRQIEAPTQIALP